MLSAITTMAEVFALATRYAPPDLAEFMQTPTWVDEILAADARGEFADEYCSISLQPVVGH
jgi:hypothetical protein